MLDKPWPSPLCGDPAIVGYIKGLVVGRSWKKLLRHIVQPSSKVFRVSNTVVRNFAAIFDTSRTWRSRLSKRNNISEI